MLQLEKVDARTFDFRCTPIRPQFHSHTKSIAAGDGDAMVQKTWNDIVIVLIKNGIIFWLQTECHHSSERKKMLPHWVNMHSLYKFPYIFTVVRRWRRRLKRYEKPTVSKMDDTVAVLWSVETRRECNFGCCYQNLCTAISYIGNVNRLLKHPFGSTTVAFGSCPSPRIAKRINKIAIHSGRNTCSTALQTPFFPSSLLSVLAHSSSYGFSSSTTSFFHSLCESFHLLKINSLWGTWKYTITVQSNVSSRSQSGSQWRQHFPSLAPNSAKDVDAGKNGKCTHAQADRRPKKKSEPKWEIK